MIKRVGAFLLAIAIGIAGPAQAAPTWTRDQAGQLFNWLERAPEEGIDLPEETVARFRSAFRGDDPEKLDEAAQTAALKLLQAWHGRCCGMNQPQWWHIDRGADDDELRAGLEAAVRNDTLGAYLLSARPRHSHYDALVQQYGQETRTDRRAIIAANLARWRWMPSELGQRYLLVNIASQNLTLWDSGRVTGRWRVIIGKPATKTPVFTTHVTGVVINPWWEIPSSIAAEGIASFVRRNPAAARARGYVYQNGRYRQMPGDNNALGRMKLVMPNPYSVFLHDTSNRELFGEERRAFSHGCIRVDRALSFAATLLARDGWDMAQVDDVVESGKTRTIDLSDHIPLYVTYFTAEPAPSGNIRFLEDLYGRDQVKLNRTATDATSGGDDPLFLSAATVPGASMGAQDYCEI